MLQSDAISSMAILAARLGCSMAWRVTKLMIKETGLIPLLYLRYERTECTHNHPSCLIGLIKHSLAASRH